MISKLLKVKHVSFVLLFSLFTTNLYSATHHHGVFKTPWNLRASLSSKNLFVTMKHLSDHNVDIAGVDRKNGIVDILISDNQYNHLISEGYQLNVVESKSVMIAPDQEYKNPSEIERIVKDINVSFPTITKLVSIGKSIEGRDIWALKISDNASVKENEPAVLFNSMHHAREIMTPEVSLDIIEQLVNGYGQNERITSWIDKNEIWVIPMFNVDGNNKMWNDDSWWRKNVRGGYGVDLNRNYPAGWNSCNGSSGSRWSQTYRGPGPASEPETKAMMNFIKEIRPVFDISYHAYSELVIYPLGCKGQKTQTEDVVEKIGKKIGKLLNYEPGTAWELLYSADGGDIDWMYEAYQVIPYVIELNSRREGFHPKYNEWRDKTVERNRVGWQFLLDRVQSSGIRGLVKKLEANNILKVYKKGQNKLYQSYVLHESGRFHLVLNPGEYVLKYNETQKEVKVGESLTNIDM